MAGANATEQAIYETISHIAAKQEEMEALRQELNLEITFNLKDTYLAVAKEQNLISLRNLALFLGERDQNTDSLEKCVRWNNHNNSLNLSFSEFSALIVSKQDRLLAKMVLERQAMGAIPNFLLQIIKKILKIELSIHEHCCRCEIQSEEDLIIWLESIIDENGDLDPAQLNASLFRSLRNEEDRESRLFLRYLRTTGNITAERLRYLWVGQRKIKKQAQFVNEYDVSLTKFNKMSTLITCPSYPTSPKSLLTCKSQKQMPIIRAEYFDCLNRPVFSQDNDIRKKKSIDNHLNRIDSTHKIKLVAKIDRRRQLYNQDLCFMLSALMEIANIQKKTQEIRVELCMCPDFYPVLFFDTFPKQKNGTVLASNLKDYLSQFGYSIELNQVYFLFRRYSKELGRLNFNSFCSIFDVSESQFNLIEKNRFIQTLNDIEVATKKVFFSLVMIASKNEHKINEIKVRLLSECSDLAGTIDLLFRQIPEGITQQKLKDLFRKHSKCQFSRREAKLLWKKLGINIKNETPIQKYHLLKELTPITFRKNKFGF